MFFANTQMQFFAWSCKFAQWTTDSGNPSGMEDWLRQVALSGSLSCPAGGKSVLHRLATFSMPKQFLLFCCQHAPLWLIQHVWRLKQKTLATCKRVVSSCCHILMWFQKNMSQIMRTQGEKMKEWEWSLFMCDQVCQWQWEQQQQWTVDIGKQLCDTLQSQFVRGRPTGHLITMGSQVQHRICCTLKMPCLSLWSVSFTQVVSQEELCQCHFHVSFCHSIVAVVTVIVVANCV